MFGLSKMFRLSQEKPKKLSQEKPIMEMNRDELNNYLNDLSLHELRDYLSMFGEHISQTLTRNQINYLRNKLITREDIEYKQLIDVKQRNQANSVRYEKEQEKRDSRLNEERLNQMIINENENINSKVDFLNENIPIIYNQLHTRFNRDPINKTQFNNYKKLLKENMYKRFIKYKTNVYDNFFISVFHQIIDVFDTDKEMKTMKCYLNKTCLKNQLVDFIKKYKDKYDEENRKIINPTTETKKLLDWSMMIVETDHDLDNIKKQIEEINEKLPEELEAQQKKIKDLNEPNMEENKKEQSYKINKDDELDEVDEEDFLGGKKQHRKTKKNRKHRKHRKTAKKSKKIKTHKRKIVKRKSHKKK
jgi:hypothetical protein